MARLSSTQVFGNLLVTGNTKISGELLVEGDIIGIDKTDVGLPNVDNTSDLDKPISTATQTALDGKAEAAHTHTIANVTGLQTALDDKLTTTGTAAAATKLATARTIGGVSFDGTANINLPGVNTTGNQNTTGSAAKLTTARTLTIGSSGKTFNGSANVAWSLAEIGAAPSSHTHDIATTTVDGFMSAADKVKLNGIAAGAQVNTITSVAGRTGVVTLTKADVGLANVDNTSDAAKPISTATQAALDGKAEAVHTHVIGDVTGLQLALDGKLATTGTAAAATKLATARTIGGVSFNGTANINLPGVNTTGNQNTTGSAATLTTARTINGTSFNGSANITTANWGTARNLTIGNATKSVNGSAAVTWSLSEIGAVDKSYVDFIRIQTTNANANLEANSGSLVSGVSTLTMSDKPVGFRLDIVGPCVVNIPAGHTLRSVDNLNTVVADGGATLIKLTSTQWWLAGNLE